MISGNDDNIRAQIYKPWYIFVYFPNQRNFAMVFAVFTGTVNLLDIEIEKIKIIPRMLKVISKSRLPVQ